LRVVNITIEEITTKYLNLKLTIYNDKETNSFNWYKSRSSVWMVMQGRRTCWRKLEYLEKTNLIGHVTTWPSHIPHRG